MTIITFNADYAHILTKQGFVSTEKTRYYLRGVFVHPCINQPGAFLVATDGHRLGCFYDAEAVAPVSGIVSLSADALHMTKPHRTEKRIIRVEVTKMAQRFGGADSAAKGDVALLDNAGDLLCGRAGDVVDGSFPDWQRVAPSFTASPDGPKFSTVVAYNAGYLGAFGFRHPDMRVNPFITMAQTDGKGPTLIRHAQYENFLGVLMPGRGVVSDEESLIPAWYLDAREAGEEAA